MTFEDALKKALEKDGVTLMQQEGEGYYRIGYRASRTKDGVETRIFARVPRNPGIPRETVSSQGTRNSSHVSDVNLHEARLVASLNHGAINAILDPVKFEYEGRTYWVSLEKDNGGKAISKLNSKIATQKLISYAETLVTGLEYLHTEVRNPDGLITKESIVHRDVTADNTILNPETGVIQFTDFGIAKRASDIKRSRMPVRGKAAYTLPEIINSQIQQVATNASYRNDLYGLGLTLLELANNERSYSIRTVEDKDGGVELQDYSIGDLSKTSLVADKEEYIGQDQNGKPIFNVVTINKQLRKQIEKAPRKLRPVFRQLLFESRESTLEDPKEREEFYAKLKNNLEKAKNQPSLTRTAAAVALGVTSIAMLGNLSASPTIIEKPVNHYINAPIVSQLDSFRSELRPYEIERLTPHIHRMSEKLQGLSDADKSKLDSIMTKLPKMAPDASNATKAFLQGIYFRRNGIHPDNSNINEEITRGQFDVYNSGETTELDIETIEKFTKQFRNAFYVDGISPRRDIGDIFGRHNIPNYSSGARFFEEDGTGSGESIGTSTSPSRDFTRECLALYHLSGGGVIPELVHRVKRGSPITNEPFRMTSGTVFSSRYKEGGNMDKLLREAFVGAAKHFYGSSIGDNANAAAAIGDTKFFTDLGVKYPTWNTELEDGKHVVKWEVSLKSN